MRIWEELNTYPHTPNTLMVVGECLTLYQHTYYKVPACEFLQGRYLEFLFLYGHK